MGALLIPFESQEPSRPTSTLVAHFSLDGSPGTSIARQWEDRTRVTCGGLCSEKDCSFKNGMCLVAVIGYVPTAMCARYSKKSDQ